MAPSIRTDMIWYIELNLLEGDSSAASTLVYSNA
jgi:hypothetical protein